MLYVLVFLIYIILFNFIQNNRKLRLNPNLSSWIGKKKSNLKHLNNSF
jgi:hypothetical protein